MRRPSLHTVEDALDALLENEALAARWHLGVALAGICAVVFHAWAAARHLRAARRGIPSPCQHARRAP